MGDNLAAELGESLADELGGWDEEEDDDEERFDEEASLPNGTHEQERDSGIDVASSPHIKDFISSAAPTNVISPSSTTSQNARNKHYRSRKPSNYDGSGYGSESDLETTDLVSASLEARLAAIEAMARRGMEENGSEGDKVVSRFTERLKDLGGLMGVEQGATRLATAYTAIHTHLNHQTRLVAQLTSTLLSPLAAPLEPEMVEDVLPGIEATLELMVGIIPGSQAVCDLHGLAGLTGDLVQKISSLRDTLQMNRETTTVAARRLKAVKDVLAEWKREDLEKEKGVRWIERGDWDHRLRERQCAKECREVVEGFEKVCGGWRERLVAG
jgi:hypothetical protein